MADSTTVLVFPIYRGVTHLDFTGPHQVLTRVPGLKAIVASARGGEIEADGLRFCGLAALKDIAACDILCVPGGMGSTAAMLDEDYLGEVRRLGEGARYLTSVCTGSLILGAAGFLKGRRAACHWAWRELLPLFGAIPDPARVVRDGRVITGGGVTAGIDFALALAAELAGDAAAQAIQLSLEYSPAPPFDAGRPETAPLEILAQVLARMERLALRRRAEAEAAARALAK
jgi:putative intracellular protease/amidase